MGAVATSPSLPARLSLFLRFAHFSERGLEDMTTSKNKSEAVKGFISDESLIQEDHRVEDLLDFSDAINKFSQKLDTIKRPAIIGLVGKFGSGKSTMLHQVRKKREKDEVWIEFDAWKYPDRKDLWEGFVLEFAEGVGDKEKRRKRLVEHRSPTVQAEAIQTLLNELIDSQGKGICIVVEDIDRSGDAGICFLETLKHNLKWLSASKAVRVIVPIGDILYKANVETYIKCLDYVDVFRPRTTKMEAFVDRVIDKKLLDSLTNYQGEPVHPGVVKGQIVSFLEELFAWNASMTPRLLKHILRKANMNYINQGAIGYGPDWRVTLCFETSKYFEYDTSTNATIADRIKIERQVTSGSLFYSFLVAVAESHNSLRILDHDTQEQHLITSSYAVKLSTRTGAQPTFSQPSCSWINRIMPTGEIRSYGVCDFYLNF